MQRIKINVHLESIVQLQITQLELHTHVTSAKGKYIFGAKDCQKIQKISVKKSALYAAMESHIHQIVALIKAKMIVCRELELSLTLIMRIMQTSKKGYRNLIQVWRMKMKRYHH